MILCSCCSQQPQVNNKQFRRVCCHLPITIWSAVCVRSTCASMITTPVTVFNVSTYVHIISLRCICIILYLVIVFVDDYSMNNCVTLNVQVIVLELCYFENNTIVVNSSCKLCTYITIKTLNSTRSKLNMSYSCYSFFLTRKHFTFIKFKCSTDYFIVLNNGQGSA